MPFLEQLKDHSACSNPSCPYGDRSYTATKAWFNPHLYCLNCIDDDRRDSLDDDLYWESLMPPQQGGAS